MVGTLCSIWFLKFSFFISFKSILIFENTTFIGVSVPKCLWLPCLLLNCYNFLHKSLFRLLVLYTVMSYFEVTSFFLSFLYRIWTLKIQNLYLLVICAKICPTFFLYVRRRVLCYPTDLLFSPIELNFFFWAFHASLITK